LNFTSASAQAKLQLNIHHKFLRNTNRFETAFRQLPVGINQYCAAGFQRTWCKVT